MLTTTDRLNKCSTATTSQSLPPWDCRLPPTRTNSCLQSGHWVAIHCGNIAYVFIHCLMWVSIIRLPLPCHFALSSCLLIHVKCETIFPALECSPGQELSNFDFLLYSLRGLVFLVRNIFLVLLFFHFKKFDLIFCVVMPRLDKPVIS